MSRNLREKSLFGLIYFARGRKGFASFMASGQRSCHAGAQDVSQEKVLMRKLEEVGEQIE
jgi:hypothetical protein